jgi:hypothetical protein
VNEVVLAANGASADEQILNGVATVAGFIPAVALAKAAAAAKLASTGTDVFASDGLERGINGLVALPAFVTGLIRPSNTTPIGC